MVLKNKKGFTLIELIVVIAILGIATPIMLSFLLSNFKLYVSYDKYMKQQEAAMDVVRILRKDIEEAKKVKFDSGILTLRYVDSTTDSSQDKLWKIEGGKLKVHPIGGSDFQDVMDLELDTSGTTNSYIGYNGSNQIIYISILPNNTNTPRDTSRNVIKPIVTEFSVFNKGF